MSACHLNASVGNSEQAARTGVCSSPSRLHHPPVRHSVPTASVGTLPPHGKAGVFALNLYNTGSPLKRVVLAGIGPVEVLQVNDIFAVVVLKAIA